MWPRASAVAERLWSEATVTDIQDAKQRIQVRKSLKNVFPSFFDFTTCLNVVFILCRRWSAECCNGAILWNQLTAPASVTLTGMPSKYSVAE
jgi:hypothetical protein